MTYEYDNNDAKTTNNNFYDLCYAFLPEIAFSQKCELLWLENHIIHLYQKINLNRLAYNY